MRCDPKVQEPVISAIVLSAASYSRPLLTGAGYSDPDRADGQPVFLRKNSRFRITAPYPGSKAECGSSAIIMICPLPEQQTPIPACGDRRFSVRSESIRIRLMHMPSVIRNFCSELKIIRYIRRTRSRPVRSGCGQRVLPHGRVPLCRCRFPRSRDDYGVSFRRELRNSPEAYLP